MLEVKRPGYREGRGYLKVDSSGLNQGKFVKLSGKWGAEAPGGFGMASTGDIKYEAATSGDTMYTMVGPFKKYHYTQEDSDLTKDVIVSGHGVVVFHDGGQFETDQYDSTITTSLNPGTLLYLDASSKLTTGVAGEIAPRALFLGTKGTSFDSNHAATGLMWYELLPYTPVYTGSQLNNPDA